MEFLGSTANTMRSRRRKRKRDVRTNPPNKLAADGKTDVHSAALDTACKYESDWEYSSTSGSTNSASRSSNVVDKHHKYRSNCGSKSMLAPITFSGRNHSLPACFSWLNLFRNPLGSIRQTLSLSLSLPKPGSAAAYVTVTLLALTATCSLCAASPCESHSWWDPVKDKCIACTVCQGELIPLRPCQLHRDTICGSIYDLKIDWVVRAKTEPNWKERRKSDELDFHLKQQLTHEQLQHLHEESIPLDWQTVALFLAVLACPLFFIVAACILIHHMRQWRRMERRLDQDVEELSTKLMSKLAEVKGLEGGTFFIGNSDALRVPTTFQPQHVLLSIPEKPTMQLQHHYQLQHQPHNHHHHDRRVLKTLQPGNVYIEESSSKG